SAPAQGQRSRGGYVDLASAVLGGLQPDRGERTGSGVGEHAVGVDPGTTAGECLPVAGGVRNVCVAQGRDRAVLAVPGTPMGGHRRRDLHPGRLDQSILAARTGQPFADRRPHPGVAGAGLRRGYFAGADRLPCGFLQDRGVGRRGSTRVERGIGRTGRDIEGRRDLMDDQRYHGEEPADEGHGSKAPENWNWIVPGSTPSPRRGRAPEAEDVSRWDALPESPSRTSQWPVHTNTGTMGASGREWWAEADPEPFTIRSARRLSPRSMVVGPINQLRSLLLPIVVGLFIGGFNPWLLAATAVAIISLLIGGLVTWQTLRYEITDDRIEIRQ